MFLAQIQKRRSIRKYTDQQIEREKIDQIIESMLRAPSSRGLTPWEFILVDDKSLLEKIGKTREFGSAFVKDAALAVIIFADPDKADTWVEDCSITAIYGQLAAESLGLGSCWVQIRARENESGISAGDYLSRLFGIPSQYQVECVLAVGYPANAPKPREVDSLPFDKFSHNQYQTPYK